jgi:hypothetical protein
VTATLSDDLIGAAVSLLVLGVAALALRAAFRPPRCSPCGITGEALPGSLIQNHPAVLEIVYHCPRCRQVVGRRRFGEWD